ncbi:MAG: hypothetical protein IJK64_12050 [Clostridia bacterium]|nr:hypothetical protein [Clostridia bacterium]
MKRCKHFFALLLAALLLLSCALPAFAEEPAQPEVWSITQAELDQYRAAFMEDGTQGLHEEFRLALMLTVPMLLSPVLFPLAAVIPFAGGFLAGAVLRLPIDTPALYIASVRDFWRFIVQREATEAAFSEACLYAKPAGPREDPYSAYEICFKLPDDPVPQGCLPVVVN